QETIELVDDYFGALDPAEVNEVELVDFDPLGEEKLLAAICYSSSHLPESQLVEQVRELSHDKKVALIRAYVGERKNRRHKPGRAFERVGYRFDVLGDYGAFRDLQRHRLLTIEWQKLTPHHGYVRPELVVEAGLGDQFDESMHRSAELYDALLPDYPSQAPYAVSMAYRMRYTMQFNAREAIHMLELRSSPQGHPSYRRVAIEMHRLIAEKAGHKAVAEAMTHIVKQAPELERLDSERKAEARRK
ncbi:MAG: FAD-dependent thymidylate synthase, partial [Actinomycetota bacterium]